jgi:hypothetical protein
MPVSSSVSPDRFHAPRGLVPSDRYGRQVVFEAVADRRLVEPQDRPRSSPAGRPATSGTAARTPSQARRLTAQARLAGRPATRAEPTVASACSSVTTCRAATSCRTPRASIVSSRWQRPSSSPFSGLQSSTRCRSSSAPSSSASGGASVLMTQVPPDAALLEQRAGPRVEAGELVARHVRDRPALLPRVVARALVVDDLDGRDRADRRAVGHTVEAAVLDAFVVRSPSVHVIRGRLMRASPAGSRRRAPRRAPARGG